MTMKTNIVLLTALFLIGCTSKKEEADLETARVKSIIEEWAHSFGGIDKNKLTSLFKSDEKLPNLFVAQPENILVTFLLDEVSLQKHENGEFTAVLPYKVSTSDKQQAEDGKQEFTLWKSGGDDFKITSFTSHLATSVLRVIRRARSDKELHLAYDSIYRSTEQVARMLRGQYDSVIYLAHVKSVELYYVTKGEWKYPYPVKEPVSPIAKIGVVEGSGKVIVPVKYDKIYNPNGTVSQFIEVENNGKRGLYSLNGEEFLAAEYDVIYPYAGEDAVVCIVKQNGKFGKVMNTGTVLFDEPLNTLSAMTEIVSKFKFEYPGTIVVLRYPYSPDEYRNTSIESLSGVIITPSYLVDMGLIKDAYEPDITMDENHMGMLDKGVSIKETASFSDKVMAVFTLFYESGIDARDYSFERTDLITYNEKLEPIERVEGLCINGGQVDFCGESTYRKVDTALYEIKKDEHVSDFRYDGMNQFTYYKIENNGDVHQMNNNRLFAFTKFVRMDESYFKTCAYSGFDYTEEHPYNRLSFNGLSYEDLDLMRNEIFADYGYKFKSEKWNKYFSKKKWYKAQFDNVDDKLTEIDKHNLKVILDYQKTIKGKTIIPDSIMYVVAG
jgi:hypothetical protein